MASPNVSNTEVYVCAPIGGNIIPLSDVKDPIFSAHLMGEGIAIQPVNGVLYAPVDGVVTCMYKSKHAIGITCTQGVEILLHIGIDTVRLDGQYFESYIKQGDFVSTGTKLVRFDEERIRNAGYDTTVMLIITNSSQYHEIQAIPNNAVNIGENILKLSRKDLKT